MVTKDTKPEKQFPSSSHRITTQNDIDLKNRSNNLSPPSKPSNIETRTDKNKKIVITQPETITTPTKYSSSFESPTNSKNNVKNVIERLSSSSSTNSTATNTTTGYDQSPDKQKSGRKSDFYEPQKFEKEFGDELKSQSEKSESQQEDGEKSVEEIILESTASNESASKSFPVIRDTTIEANNLTGISLNKNSDHESSSRQSAGLSGQDSESISGVLPLKNTSENQSTSAGDKATTDSSRNDSQSPLNTIDKDTPDDRTDTEIESLPKDVNDKYDSEFETEATESLMESSILEMSFNESNLNFSYSTVGMVTSFILNILIVIKIYLLSQVDRMIYTEEMKSEQMTALIGVRTKSMIDRLKGQISFLEVKKQRCKGSGQSGEAQSIRKKQRAILMKLEQAKTSLKK